MSKAKELTRDIFFAEVVTRADLRCQAPGCRFRTVVLRAREDLDAHHITSRKRFPRGGYVRENGISLCKPCHVKAERGDPGFEAEALYKIIGSSYDKARVAEESEARAAEPHIADLFSLPAFKEGRPFALDARRRDAGGGAMARRAPGRGARR